MNKQLGEEMAKVAGKPSKSAQIRDALSANPEKSTAEIAKDTGVTVGLVLKEAMVGA